MNEEVSDDAGRVGKTRAVADGCRNTRGRTEMAVRQCTATTTTRRWGRIRDGMGWEGAPYDVTQRSVELGRKDHPVTFAGNGVT